VGVRNEQRPADEFGARRAERELILRLHRTAEDIPRTGSASRPPAPLFDAVDKIVRLARRIDSERAAQ
jgi:hypothetical protein